MARTSGPEAQLYPIVERWARKSLGCWEVALDTGPRAGRIDVAGVRDVGGGDLASRSEVVAIEVKTGTSSFAKSAGQAHGYSVIADRCYLAIPTSGGFSDEHLLIAGQLGIGLLEISGAGRIREALSAPICQPVMQFRLQMLEKMHCAPCAMCGTVFRIGDNANHFRNLVRRGARAHADVSDAAEDEKGIVWWLTKHSEERDASGRSYTYRRRYLCPDCVYALAPGMERE